MLVRFAPPSCFSLMASDFEGVGGVEPDGSGGLAGGMLMLRTLSRIICRMVLRNAFRNSAVLSSQKGKEKMKSYSYPKCVTPFTPVGEVVDLLGTTVQRILQVNEFPQVMRLHVLSLSRPHLNFRHRDQHLIANDFHLRCGALCCHTLRVQRECYQRLFFVPLEGLKE